MQRATQTVESYMAVPAGPLPWQSDADLNKEKEKKKGEWGYSFIHCFIIALLGIFSASILLFQVK